MKEKKADIDILEEMIKPIATRTFLFLDGRKEEKEIYNLERKQIEAIKTIIAENKELKEKIKEINEEYNAEQKHEMENTIPKSKVEEKIQELEKIKQKDEVDEFGIHSRDWWVADIIQEQFKELLDERNNTEVRRKK